MMKLLIVGNSSLVKRKIAPTLEENKLVKSFDIATTSNTKFSYSKLQTTYSDYTEAISKSDANIVYISLPNSMHYDFSRMSMLFNKDVIVDKPAITKKNELNKLYDLAKKNNLAITMSCVFNYHKCWKKFKDISLKNNNKGVLSVNFTIPKLDKSNIRMSNKLAGGALNDMAIYSSNIGYLFWERQVGSLKVNKYTKNKLVIGFTVLANYGNGKDLIGNFGFEKNYKNNVTYLGENFETSYDRVFSPPIDFETKIIRNKNEDLKEFLVGKDDVFKNYFNYVFKNVQNNKKILREEFRKINQEYLNYLR